MKLLLTSSGITNSSIKKSLSELLGKPYSKANVVFIPTAANLEKGDKAWLIDDMYRFRKLNFASFDMIDISTIPKNVYQSILEAADIIVFGGGNVNYLLEQLEKSGLQQILPKLIKTKVYVGISAGSMITASNISLSSAGILYYENTGGFKNKKGLGFVNFEIRPHLNSPWFPKVTLEYLEELAKHTSRTFYAIDDNTAIAVIDTKINVISEGKWKKFN